MSIIRTALTSAALLACSLSASAYNQVIAFGDSLSDDGLLHSLSLGLAPAAPYWNGRFSDGRVAVEYLAQNLGVGLTDLAIGGASTGLKNTDAPFPLDNTGMLSQLGLYLSATGAHSDPNSLYFLWGGPNDFLALLDTPSLDPSTVGRSAILNLAGAVNALYGTGARNFVLPLMPDLGVTPRALSLDHSVPGAAFALSALSLSFNINLARTYSVWGSAHPDAHLTVFDTFTAQHVLLANASALGITNITEPCFTGSATSAGTLCADSSKYFYFDDIHPTTLVHQALGQALTNQLTTAVPEPATYGLMALGLMGIALRRYRQQTA